jgi:4-hydroxymandelate oxidase
VLTLADVEAAAADRIEPVALDYMRGGADDEVTLAESAVAWQRLRLRPRVLRGGPALDVSTTVLGTPVRLPVMSAPVAYHMLAHPEGESATARGVAAAGAVMVQSTMATQTLEAVAAAAPGGARWFQVYVMRDRGWTAELAARAAAAGYSALVLTVDVPMAGRRLRDERNGFGLPLGLELAHKPPHADLASTGSATGSATAAFMSTMADPTLTFDDIGWMREVSGLPVVVKGVLRGDDAISCIDAGAAAVTVSTHGGRQLDTVVASADVLAEIVDAADGRAEVYVDGGIRTGTDILKALALGARAVMIGRPVVYGLAVGGSQGVTDVFAMLENELKAAMTLCGAATLASLTRDLVSGQA